MQNYECYEYFEFICYVTTLIKCTLQFNTTSLIVRLACVCMSFCISYIKTHNNYFEINTVQPVIFGAHIIYFRILYALYFDSAITGTKIRSRLLLVATVLQTRQRRQAKDWPASTSAIKSLTSALAATIAADGMFLESDPLGSGKLTLSFWRFCLWKYCRIDIFLHTHTRHVDFKIGMTKFWIDFNYQ